MCEGDRFEELKELVSTIPTELEELYTRAIRRTRRTTALAIKKQNYEAYIMFQIAIHSLRPFEMKDFLAVALLITTSCSETQELSVDQIKRRLNSPSAGLLERSSYGVVQFIHQTVKDFMVTGRGRKLICESVGVPPGKFH